MQQAELALSLAVDDLRGLQKEWDAAKEREAALSAELEERRGAIEAAEKAVEELQERIRQETLDAGDLSRRHRAAAAAVERFDSAAMMLRERRRRPSGAPASWSCPWRRLPCASWRPLASWSGPAPKLPRRPASARRSTRR